MPSGDSQPFKLPEQPSVVQVHLGGIRVMERINGHPCEWSMAVDFKYEELGQGAPCATCPNQLNCIAKPGVTYTLSKNSDHISFKFDVIGGWTAEP